MLVTVNQLLNDGVGKGACHIRIELGSLLEGEVRESDVVYALGWVAQCRHRTHRRKVLPLQSVDLDDEHYRFNISIDFKLVFLPSDGGSDKVTILEYYTLPVFHFINVTWPRHADLSVNSWTLYARSSGDGALRKLIISVSEIFSHIYSVCDDVDAPLSHSPAGTIIQEYSSKPQQSQAHRRPSS